MLYSILNNIIYSSFSKNGMVSFFWKITFHILCFNLKKSRINVIPRIAIDCDYTWKSRTKLRYTIGEYTQTNILSYVSMLINSWINLIEEAKFQRIFLAPKTKKLRKCHKNSGAFENALGCKIRFWELSGPERTSLQSL